MSHELTKDCPCDPTILPVESDTFQARPGTFTAARYDEKFHATAAVDWLTGRGIPALREPDVPRLQVMTHNGWA